MKGTFAIVGILAFSALLLSPSMPQEYPTQESVALQADIKLKESGLVLLIDKIENSLKIDSLEIKEIKKPQYGY